MKKFSEILAEISATRAEITKAEKLEEKLTNAIHAEPDLLAKLAKKKASENDLTQCVERARDLKISVALLKNNAKLALFAEVMPVALEVLAKYKGKPYGEKTREKISEEVKARTGCRFYIYTRYREAEYSIYPADVYSNDYNITVGAKYDNGNQKALLTDNRIQLVNMDDLQIFYINKQYVEDIPATVQKIREAYDAARAAQEALETACSEFNKLSVDGLPHLSSRENIYPRILV